MRYQVENNREISMFYHHRLIILSFYFYFQQQHTFKISPKLISRLIIIKWLNDPQFSIFSFSLYSHQHSKFQQLNIFRYFCVWFYIFSLCYFCMKIDWLKIQISLITRLNSIFNVKRSQKNQIHLLKKVSYLQAISDVIFISRCMLLFNALLVAWWDFKEKKERVEKSVVLSWERKLHVTCTESLSYRRKRKIYSLILYVVIR